MRRPDIRAEAHPESGRRHLYPMRNVRSWCSSTQAGTAEVHPLSRRDQPIRILYASQTGTAMLFSKDLEEAILEAGGGDGSAEAVSVQSWKEAAAAGSGRPCDVLTPGAGLHLFLVSVTGVGEPPDNGRDFYQWIMNQDGDGISDVAWPDLEYAVFGLGNKKAHPNHYNVIGKRLDERLASLGARRVLSMGLGDDGDCIEDDFDHFVEKVSNLLVKQEASGGEDGEESPAEAEDVASGDGQKEEEAQQPRMACSPDVSSTEDCSRLKSKKYPVLKLLPPFSDIVRQDLFHLQGTANQFYSDTTRQWQVLGNQSLAPNGGGRAIHEMRIAVKEDKNTLGGDGRVPGADYETGDHLIIYPRNSSTLVEAYLNRLDVNPHAIVADDDAQDDKYPHPKGLTVAETLSHCVDLGALPSASFSRLLLGRNDFDYKTEIAYPRRTVIDLLGQQGPPETTKIALEDLLYNIAPMKPRYYSIASSNLQRPDEVLLAFRPIKYVTSRGIMREGVCTSYMTHRASGVFGSEPGVVDCNASRRASVAATINSNPSFRLPEDPKTSLLMIAGGCGVAPIRAFVEERLALKKASPTTTFGPCRLYLGFRNPQDQVYQSLIESAVAEGALTEATVTFSSGCSEPGQRCMLVTELISTEGRDVWEHLESGGYTILCGGARTFGVAVGAKLMDVLQEHGRMSWDEAEEYKRKLYREGRWLEDLAD